MASLAQAGWRCTACGRLDANSNQPCTEHGDVEPVYRLVEEGTGESVDPSETSEPMTFLTPRQIKLLRKVFEEALTARDTEDPEFEILNSLRDRLYP